jgi:hypothetical protein
MKPHICASILLLGAPAFAQRGGRVQPDPIDFEDHPGWTQLFDGKSLTGWDGDPEVWKVEDGVIAGAFNSPEGTRNGQTFLIWKGGELGDFELKWEIKLEGLTADSGVQYRGGPAQAKWNLTGYQFDFNFPGAYNGQVAEAGPGARGIIAYRGQVVRAEQDKRPRLISNVGTMEALGGLFKTGDWNQAHLIARGNTLIQMINGHVMSILIDEDPTKFKAKGLFGLQCAGSGTVKISFRNIWLRKM